MLHEAVTSFGLHDVNLVLHEEGVAAVGVDQLLPGYLAAVNDVSEVEEGGVDQLLRGVEIDELLQPPADFQVHGLHSELHLLQGGAHR